MFIFRIKCQASANNPDYHAGDEMHFLVLIDFQDKWGAEILASSYLHESGWENVQLLATKVTTEQEIAEATEAQKADFEEAEKFGYLLIAYPEEPQRAHEHNK